MQRGLKLAAILFLGTVLCLPAMAFGAGSPYLSVQAGLVFLDDNDAGVLQSMSFDTGGFGALALGYDLGPSYSHARIEAELAYRQNAIDDVVIFGDRQKASGDLRVGTLMGNGYYQFDNPSMVKPFVMAGFGLAWLQADSVRTLDVVVLDDDDVQVAGQAGAGLSVQFNPQLAFDLGYKYLWTAKTEFRDETNQAASFDCQTHNVYAGVRFNF